AYNTVIHRHPDGINSFSSTDEEAINANFELSLLYTEAKGFVDGLFNNKHSRYCKLRYPLKMIEEKAGTALPDIPGEENITKKTYNYNKTSYKDDDYGYGLFGYEERVKELNSQADRIGASIRKTRELTDRDSNKFLEFIFTVKKSDKEHLLLYEVVEKELLLKSPDGALLVIDDWEIGMNITYNVVDKMLVVEHWFGGDDRSMVTYYM